MIQDINIAVIRKRRKQIVHQFEDPKKQFHLDLLDVLVDTIRASSKGYTPNSRN